MTCGCFIWQLAGELTCSFHFDVFQGAHSVICCVQCWGGGDVKLGAVTVGNGPLLRKLSRDLAKDPAILALRIQPKDSGGGPKILCMCVWSPELMDVYKCLDAH